MIAAERPLEGPVRTQHQHDESAENDRPSGPVHRPVLPLRPVTPSTLSGAGNNNAKSGKPHEQAKRAQRVARSLGCSARGLLKMPDGGLAIKRPLASSRPSEN